jgi:hypothetical protein
MQQHPTLTPTPSRPRWVAADAWLAAVEHRRAGDVAVPSYQLVELPQPDRPTKAGGRRQRLSDAEYRQAADLARSIGVRPAARQLGVSHAALLRGWQRRGIRVTSP